MQETDLDVFLP